MIEPVLQKEINQVMASARERRLEFVTVEHLLLALLNTPDVVVFFNRRNINMETSEVSCSSILIVIHQPLQTIQTLTLSLQLGFREFYKEAFIKHNLLKKRQLPL